MKKRSSLALPLVILMTSLGNQQLSYAQNFYDALKARLPLIDRNKLFEAEALEYRADTICEITIDHQSGQTSAKKKKPKNDSFREINKLEAFVFYADANQLRFEVIQKYLNALKEKVTGESNQIEYLHKFDQRVEDSIELVYDLRRAADREKSIIDKYPLLNQSIAIENVLVIRMEKLLYVYMNLPAPYEKDWLNSIDSGDPYMKNSTTSQTRDSAIIGPNNPAGSMKLNSLQIYNMMDISEPQVDFFNDFLASRFPLADSSIDFGAIAYCNIDSLRSDWQEYLGNNENLPEAELTEFFTLLGHGRSNASASNKTTADFEYKIQIASGKTKLNLRILHTKYPDIGEISEIVEPGIYRYTIGHFKSFREASDHKNRMNIEGAEILAFLNKKHIEISAYNRLPAQKPIVHQIGVK